MHSGVTLRHYTKSFLDQYSVIRWHVSISSELLLKSANPTGVDRLTRQANTKYS